MKQFAVGIDLHGTLLNERWEIEECHVPVITGLIDDLEQRCDFYICTGNNLEFVDQYVNQQIRDRIKGYVLETGSVYSDKETQHVLVDEERIRKIKELEDKLRNTRLSDALFFAERLATISIFTKYREKGRSPNNLWERISEFVDKNGSSNLFNVTHSDVAVDIVTRGINKYTGLKRVGTSLQIISVADSFNDLEFLMHSAISYIPGNSTIMDKQRMFELPIEIQSISSFKGGLVQKRKVFYKSPFPYTKGLIDILETIKKSFD